MFRLFTTLSSLTSTELRWSSLYECGLEAANV